MPVARVLRPGSQPGRGRSLSSQLRRGAADTRASRGAAERGPAKRQRRPVRSSGAGTFAAQFLLGGVVPSRKPFLKRRGTCLDRYPPVGVLIQN